VTTERALRAPSRDVPQDVATRRRLLEAATELFAERGFRRVTVRAITTATRKTTTARTAEKIAVSRVPRLIP
jgi:AcrR family transcriptional regulator